MQLGSGGLEKPVSRFGEGLKIGGARQLGWGGLVNPFIWAGEKGRQLS